MTPPVICIVYKLLKILTCIQLIYKYYDLNIMLFRNLCILFITFCVCLLTIWVNNLGNTVNTMLKIAIPK